LVAGAPGKPEDSEKTPKRLGAFLHDRHHLHREIRDGGVQFHRREPQVGDVHDDQPAEPGQQDDALDKVPLTRALEVEDDRNSLPVFECRRQLVQHLLVDREASEEQHHRDVDASMIYARLALLSVKYMNEATSMPLRSRAVRSAARPRSPRSGCQVALLAPPASKSQADSPKALHPRRSASVRFVLASLHAL
jgi:hypothetical protein